MASLLIGQRFRIIASLNAGGMGVAYRAWDELLGRPVVVKQPHRTLLSTPETLERFDREIRVLAALQHPHVVPILSHGLHDGVPFIAMRFLPGGSLNHRRRKYKDATPRPQQPATLHLWLPAIAATLDFIHSRGVVHRDIKPTNIFFDAWWTAFIGDFGIAKVVTEASALQSEHTYTGTNISLGTLDYMAPELIRAQGGIDGRADQYALAVVVYEMLAARKPFRSNDADLIDGHATMPPPLASAASGLPASLHSAVHKALATQPNDRFATCSDFAAAALRDVPPQPEIDGYARLLCPMCGKILKLSPNAENQIGSCTRCRANLTVAAGFEALWLPEEAAAFTALVTPTEGEWSEATPTPPSPSNSPTAVGQLGEMLRKLTLVRAARPPRPATKAIVVSFVTLVLLLLWLALLVAEPPTEERPRFILSGWVYEDDFELFDHDLPVLEGSVVRVGEVNDHTPIPEEHLFVDAHNAAMGIYSDRSLHLPFTAEFSAPSELLSTVNTSGSASGAFTGRSDSTLQRTLVFTQGGNAQSEAAVDAGIQWIVNHQMPDGSWDFDFTKCPICEGKCSGIGSFRDRGGATALALLPLLGRGYTHKEGPYKKQVRDGIRFLVELAEKGQGKAYEKTGSLYCQGLAGIALSEAYAISDDRRLAGPAQTVLNYIMSAQDPQGGGWRYESKQPGDTSATGWQLTALKAGQAAFLQVNPLTINKAVDFLDSTQADNGAAYGYQKADDALGTSAVGLLCRMNLGWKKDNPALQRGVARLAREGPNADLYFNYYATQVLHHMEGDAWVRWNTKMRDTLVNAQQKKGHAAGSWWDGFEQGHAPTAGGRLYTTAMATMILEVYYRHLPIYSKAEADQEFKE